MSPCALNRLLLPAFVVGFLVASVTASDAAGWIAAGLVVVASVVVQRIRGGTTSCSIPIRDEQRAAGNVATTQLASVPALDRPPVLVPEKEAQ